MFVADYGVHMAPGGCNGQMLCGAVRARTLRALSASMSTFLTDDERVRYVTQLEACAVALTANDHTAYLSMMSRVAYNLKTNGEHIIRTYPLSKVCRLSHKHLRAHTSHAERTEAIDARLQELMTRVEQEAEAASRTASSIHTESKIACPKCHATEDITRVLAQLRRGDEGMTTRCMCKCGYTWNMSS